MLQADWHRNDLLYVRAGDRQAQEGNFTERPRTKTPGLPALGESSL
jgi:hypothetical protein